MNSIQEHQKPGEGIRRKQNPWLTALVYFGTVVLLGLGSAPARADLVIPGADGSDGALTITANTQIDLSDAILGEWDDPSTPDNEGRGIYDPEKWAVVFKYSSVTVNAGATVTFRNHPSRAPVVWLVTGDVTINGTVSLDGGRWVGAPGLASPGPGGFRGGTGYYSSGVGTSAGFGSGGGGRNYAGSFGTIGSSGTVRYGNPALIPLIGGSGGGGDIDENAGGGSGAGGMLIGASGSIIIGGSIRANGGAGIYFSVNNPNRSGGGSGGAIRLVARTLSGGGVVQALGGEGYWSGGLGRIRLERASYSGSLTVTPDPSVVNLADGAIALIWPPDNAPTVKVVSIGGIAAPNDPRAEFGAVGADVALPQSSTVQLVVETTHVEEASQVRVRMTPRANAEYQYVAATKDSVLVADPLTVRWIANVPVGIGYSALQVHVIRP